MLEKGVVTATGCVPLAGRAQTTPLAELLAVATVLDWARSLLRVHTDHEPIRKGLRRGAAWRTAHNRPHAGAGRRVWHSFDDIGYETEKEEDERSLDMQFDPLANQRLAKVKTVDYGNPFNTQAYINRNRAGLFSDNSGSDDGFFYQMKGGKINPFNPHKSFQSKRHHIPKHATQQ